MRASWLYCLTAAVWLATSLEGVRAGRQAILPREDAPSTAKAAPTTSAPPATTRKSDEPAASSGSAKENPSDPASLSSQSSGRSSGSEVAATSTDPSSTNAAAPTDASLSNATSIGNITNIPVVDGLPIHPEVTPALAVAGALLILTGAVYTLVGIKTKWLHIFVSTAYLFSLCVIILIVYVMQPPVSNGVQGAYLVAAGMTGIIFGAVAVVFADVTEGLGCFLGGFCLGMWFLVLKADGLITSQAGKAIFLSCFTVGGFALYISHYTRPYGLIGSVSFAGATAVLLGVDMFARSGLKEFWLYIWDLNDGLFPLHYQGPYQLTRGMRVEIACIVLFCLLGIMSQMKVWNIIKQRREQKAAEQRRKDEIQNQTEEELGRKLEEDNDRDRAVWDAVYGKKGKGSGSQTDSGIGTSQASTRKGSMSIFEGGMEMQSIASAGGPMGKGVVTVHVAQDGDPALPSPIETKLIRSKAETSKESSVDLPQHGAMKSTATDAESIKATKSAAKKPFIDFNLPLAPKLVPLPFNVPDPAIEDNDDDKSSVATFAASELGLDRSFSRSKRLSGSAPMRTLSGRSKRASFIPTASEEALVIPHDDDRASSVAVALDGISIHSLSHEKLASGNQSPASSDPRSPASENPTPYFVAKPRLQDFDFEPPRENDTEDASDVADAFKSRSIRSASSEAEPNAVGASLAGNLPDNASKVVMAYRTNEWAKHLDHAEAPVVEDAKDSKPQVLRSGETAAPVNVKELQQTALTAEPAPATSSAEDQAQTSSPTESANSYSKPPSPRISPSASNTNLNRTVPRSPSQTSLSSNYSNEGVSSSRSLARTRAASSSAIRGLRSSSSPMISSPLAEPIDEDAESSFPARAFTPNPMHLMSQRESTIQSRSFSTSLLNRQGSGPQRTLSGNPSLANMHETAAVEADDDIPLAQRKSLLQRSSSQQSTTPPPPQRSNSNNSSPAISSNDTPLDLSRNPSRLSLAPRQSATLLPAHSTTNQAALAWRASLANDSSHQVAKETAGIERRRSQMLVEKQRQRDSRASERQREEARKSKVDREMRRRGSGMMDAHREAMRRMQGGVNQALQNREVVKP